MKKLLILPLLTAFAIAQNSNNNEKILVKISKDISSINTTDNGHKVKISRVQDSDNVLTDDYTKTSRACPPFCIQPTKIDKNIQNIEELELLSFIQNKVTKNRGILVDSRLKSWFELETIPSSINIPYTALQNQPRAKVQKIFKALGMKIKTDKTWDFSNVKELAIFDNGVWCKQAQYFVEALLKYNYPTSKLSYYRSGFQGWKLVGLTTIVHKEIVK